MSAPPFGASFEMGRRLIASLRTANCFPECVRTSAIPLAYTVVTIPGSHPSECSPGNLSGFEFFPLPVYDSRFRAAFTCAPTSYAFWPGVGLCWVPGAGDDVPCHAEDAVGEACGIPRMVTNVKEGWIKCCSSRRCAGARGDLHLRWDGGGGSA
eukprot:3041567-Pyramimonas_sp.AAC.1